PAGGPPGGLAVDVRARAVGGRSRGRGVVSREAAGAVRRPRLRRAAGDLPGPRGAGLQVGLRPAGSPAPERREPRPLRRRGSRFDLSVFLVTGVLTPLGAHPM